ncbi:MAG: hypothetical protein KatS3mg078_1034 [Deltaproteobacteria bacterium]|jgi:hypothetical protein|nr:MAG: hypothetical protein KatS3mg078_1034 [Deltaproteobacteria bacterium]
MRNNLIFTLIVLLAFFASGGCEVDFGGTNNNSNSGENNESILRGTITSIVPDRDLSGITVQIEDKETGSFFSDTTDSSGFFQIEGSFHGTLLRLEFLDESSSQIAITSVTVFPGAEVDLGSISINNGIVNIEGDIVVVFEGDVIENNCSGGTGTIEVETDSTEVIVQVLSSTEITRDSDELACEDILIGNEVEIRGMLLPGDTVQADSIEVK